ncbi:DUF3102 domain-containing protein [Bradyrhizobium sp. USDA 4503]
MGSAANCRTNKSCNITLRLIGGARANSQADRIRQQCAISVIGKALIEAKRYLSHGEFLRWVESEVCIAFCSSLHAGCQVGRRRTRNRRAFVAVSPLLALCIRQPEEFAANILKPIEAVEYIPLSPCAPS